MGTFLTQHNCRSQELIEQRLKAIRQAIPAVRDRALIEAATAMTRVLVELIATLREGIASFDRQIAQATAVHPDFVIFDSFPGAGPALAPRLLAAFGAQRGRYQSTADLPLTTVSCGIAEKTITPPSGHWLSNGSESPFVAGKTVFPTTTPTMSRISAVVVHR